MILLLRRLKTSIVMPDLISLPRTPFRGHPVEIIADSGGSLSASFCGGFIPNLIRGSKFYPPFFVEGLPACVFGWFIRPWLGQH